jgi:phospholipid/cholesterol/gamma-HCH transport system substrate-binding protein
MRMRTIEISVGAFMLAGILATIFLAVRVSGVNFGAAAGSYTVYARFDEIAGLRVRSKVSMAGVTIGRVAGITVDAEYGEAVVALEIDGGIDNLSVDTGAQIQTEGILGGRYVSLIPGADEEYLEDGDTITDTQGAFVLENLIGELVTRMGGS